MKLKLATLALLFAPAVSAPVTCQQLKDLHRLRSCCGADDSPLNGVTVTEVDSNGNEIGVKTTLTCAQVKTIYDGNACCTDTANDPVRNVAAFGLAEDITIDATCDAATGIGSLEIPVTTYKLTIDNTVITSSVKADGDVTDYTYAMSDNLAGGYGDLTLNLERGCVYDIDRPLTVTAGSSLTINAFGDNSTRIPYLRAADTSVPEFGTWPSALIEVLGDGTAVDAKNIGFQGVDARGDETNILAVVNLRGANNVATFKQSHFDRFQMWIGGTWGSDNEMHIDESIAARFTNYPGGMFFGGVTWGGGDWMGTWKKQSITNSFLEGVFGEMVQLYADSEFEIEGNTFANVAVSPLWNGAAQGKPSTFKKNILYNTNSYRYSDFDVDSFGLIPDGMVPQTFGIRKCPGPQNCGNDYLSQYTDNIWVETQGLKDHFATYGSTWEFEYDNQDPEADQLPDGPTFTDKFVGVRDKFFYDEMTFDGPDGESIVVKHGVNYNDGTNRNCPNLGLDIGPYNKRMQQKIKYFRTLDRANVPNAAGDGFELDFTWSDAAKEAKYDTQLGWMEPGDFYLPSTGFSDQYSCVPAGVGAPQDLHKYFPGAYKTVPDAYSTGELTGVSPGEYNGNAYLYVVPPVTDGACYTDAYGSRRYKFANVDACKDRLTDITNDFGKYEARCFNDGTNGVFIRLADKSAADGQWGTSLSSTAATPEGRLGDVVQQYGLIVADADKAPCQ